MCTAATARRRRKQAVNGYKHIAKLGRPRYRKVDATKSKRKLEAALAVIRMMQARPKKT